MRCRLTFTTVLPFALHVHVGLASNDSLADLGLEELAQFDVATVSRKAQRLSETPAAVTILSAEDIRRSGARTIAEALREVPGMNVAQYNAGGWSVGIRGATGQFSNKLLVQLDGRSVYNPFFSGVFWEALDVMLEDVERIEVVRGPGASLWGANAVNGVINIVTHKATATRGTLVGAQVDHRGNGALSVREGGDLGGGAALRVFAKASQATPTWLESPQTIAGNNRGWQAGFRADGAYSGLNAWTAQGGVFRRSDSGRFSSRDLNGDLDSLPVQFNFDGGYLLGRYRWGWWDGEASVQTYVDRMRIEENLFGSATVNTLDVDFQHRLPAAGAHEWLWGGGARYVTANTLLADPSLSINPSQQHLRTFAAFVQDEITLQPRRWKLTLGTRFEYSSIAHLEPQPTARLMWTPSASDSVWANWSRAARIPSIGETSTSLVYGLRQTADPALPILLLQVMPGPGWRPRAERVDTWELGYRRALKSGSVEAVLFHHDYRRLIDMAADPAGAQVALLPYFGIRDALAIQNVYRNNQGSAHSTGIELGADWQVSQAVRTQFSFTHIETSAKPDEQPLIGMRVLPFKMGAPRQWASVRGLFDLGRGHELDAAVRWVGPVSQGHVPAYSAFDMRYGWRVSPTFRFSVVGLNLLDRRHAEYISTLPSFQTYVGRQVYAQGVWCF